MGQADPFISQQEGKEDQARQSSLFGGRFGRRETGGSFEGKELSFLRVAALLRDQIVALSLARDQGSDDVLLVEFCFPLVPVFSLPLVFLKRGTL
jgi:hypothetical protein